MLKALAFALLAGAATLAHADRCTTWIDRDAPAKIETCSYDSGGSGYYRVANKGNQAATVCWTIEFNDGKKDKGCNLRLEPTKPTNGSCFNCGARNVGVKAVDLTKYEVKP